MPRASSDKKAKAEKLFNKGMKLVDIARKLDIPEGTIRSWKNRGKWAANSSKKTNATLQKKKRKKMQRCKKGNGEGSQVIEMQKAQEVVRRLFAIRMQKHTEPILKYIGMFWMKMNRI